MGSKVVIGGMEFDDKQAEAIVESMAGLSKAIEKVAKAFDGVTRELGRMGKENSLFFAEMLRAAHIAESFAEPDAKYTMTRPQARDLRAYFQNNQKISAIKIIREVTHLGLKEAKDMVDKFWDGANGGVEGLLKDFKIVPAEIF